MYKNVILQQERGVHSKLTAIQFHLQFYYAFSFFNSIFIDFRATIKATYSIGGIKPAIEEVLILRSISFTRETIEFHLHLFQFYGSGGLFNSIIFFTFKTLRCEDGRKVGLKLNQNTFASMDTDVNMSDAAEGPLNGSGESSKATFMSL